MKSVAIVATFALGCAAGLSAASAFEIVTAQSGFVAPIRLLDDPDDQSGGTPTINEFTSSASEPAYRTPKDAFDKSFSYSGYGFEDEALADHSGDDQAKALPVPAKPVAVAKKPLAKH